MSKSRLSALAAILVLGGVPQAAVPSEDVSGEAERILQEMSDYLAAAQEFRFQAEVSYDSVQSTGEKIEFGAAVEVSVRRPDRLRVNNEGDEARRRIFIDGTTMTMYDLEADVYATSQVPADLDAALDLVFEKFGLSVPVADLIYRDPFSTLIASVKRRRVLVHRVLAVRSIVERRAQEILEMFQVFRRVLHENPVTRLEFHGRQLG